MLGELPSGIAAPDCYAVEEISPNRYHLWLEEIPAHWEMRRLKMVASVQLSNVDKKSLEGQEPVRLVLRAQVPCDDARAALV